MQPPSIFDMVALITFMVFILLLAYMMVAPRPPVKDESEDDDDYEEWLMELRHIVSDETSGAINTALADFFPERFDPEPSGPAAANNVVPIRSEVADAPGLS